MYANGSKVRKPIQSQPSERPGQAVEHPPEPFAKDPISGQAANCLSYEHAIQDRALAQSKLVLGVTFEVPGGLQPSVARMVSCLRSGVPVAEETKVEFAELMNALVEHQVAKCERDLVKLRGQDFPGYTKLEREAFKEILQWVAMVAFREARSREALLKSLLGE